MEKNAVEELQGIIDKLTGPEGCPWDKGQTPETLCDYIIEESFELVDCIRSGDIPGTAEELGDVLFLLLFVATLAQKRGDFTLAEAFDAAAAKMIRRHPHVFAGAPMGSEQELREQWERIKLDEKNSR